MMVRRTDLWTDRQIRGTSAGGIVWAGERRTTCGLASGEVGYRMCEIVGTRA